MKSSFIHNLKIGTSGIVVPGSKQSFPTEFQTKSRLNYYSSLLNTVEINSTFKKIPQKHTFEKWSDDVTQKFEFTLKLWKEITHAKQLNIEPVKIETFISAARAIARKGCLLIQFPGSITNGYFNKVEEILKRICESDEENQWKKAIEFRSATWYNQQTFDLLTEYGASLVLHDMPKSKNLDLNIAFPFYYFRFHGPTGNYRDSYDIGFLKENAVKIKNLLSQGKQVYAYFNNTMGSAFENATSLRSLVEEE